MVHSVLIGVPTAEMARNGVFYDYVDQLIIPEGAAKTYARGQSPARNRNLIIKQALANDFEYVLFLDDDILFPPNLIERLMRHNKDVVSAYYLMRSFPHKPILYDIVDEKGRCMQHFPSDGEVTLVKAVGFGLGACLIKTQVFKEILDRGLVEIIDGDLPCWITLGELVRDHWCDDLAFFHKVTAAGYDLWCDISTPVGHIFQGVVWPDYKDNKWHVTYDSFGMGTVSFPMPRPENV